jgi:hypothetical protein
MSDLPPTVRDVLCAWAGEFSRSVWPRFQLLVFAAIVCVGRHTACRLLRVASVLAVGHWSSYHRVLSRRRWSTWRLAWALAERVLIRFAPRGVVPICGDGTVTQHRGKKVHGKARHRDAVRSSHSYTACRYGHKWVVLAVQVRLPGLSRPWALPILCALYRSAEDNRRIGRRHKTPCELMRQLLRVILRWFPQRQFAFVGDGGYGTHAMAEFAARQPGLTLVSKFHKDANLYDPPPRRRPGTNGRPRLKGRKRPSPQGAVANTTRRQHLRVAWYGGGARRVAVVTGTAHWYKGGEGLVAVRWVFVEDVSGTHRDEYFFTTDVTLTPKQIIEAYTGRWAIEVMFAEVREHLGLESTRGWCARTVLRAEPCLFGLDTLVAVWFADLPTPAAATPDLAWVVRVKPATTFSDAITSVRQHVWRHWVLKCPRHAAALQKLTPRERTSLIELIARGY